MVMDEKVKESFVLDTASAICNYDTHYKDHPKYWCRGYFRDYCNIIAFTPNSTDRVALRDTGNQLIVTVSCLTKEDTGWYWCGIQRDFARDDMDFTELVVTDDRRAITNNFWSGQGKEAVVGLAGGDPWWWVAAGEVNTHCAPTLFSGLTWSLPPSRVGWLLMVLMINWEFGGRGGCLGPSVLLRTSLPSQPSDLGGSPV